MAIAGPAMGCRIPHGEPPEQSTSARCATHNRQLLRLKSVVAAVCNCSWACCRKQQLHVWEKYDGVHHGEPQAGVSIVRLARFQRFAVVHSFVLPLRIIIVTH